MEAFQSCLEAIAQHSPNAALFALIHKMDLGEVGAMCDAKNLKHKCFRTSIWDETLYKAWSTIVTTLIPNVDVLQRQLVAFGNICEADEVVMFEKATFLVIS